MRSQPITQCCAIVAAVLTLSGCNNVKRALFPGDHSRDGATDPASVCRGSPTTFIRDANFPPGSPGLLTDNTTVLTGYTNGDDGATESVKLCKRDSSNVLFGCVTVGQTGVLPDGVVIQFIPTSVIVQLAASKGYALLTITLSLTCHGK